MIPLFHLRVYKVVILSLLCLLFWGVTILPSYQAGIALMSAATAQQHSKIQTPIATPTAAVTVTPTPKKYTDRQELIKDADKFAIEKLGYEDLDKNGIPDYRETYVLNVHDCASVSAEFNDVLKQMGKAGVLDSEQAAGALQLRGGKHAANWVPGIGVIDVTPVRTLTGFEASKGTPWYNFPRNTEGFTEGFPDRGEYTFAGYRGPLQNTMSGQLMSGLGGGGGGGSGGSGGLGGGNPGFMGILTALLISQKNSSNTTTQQQTQPQPTPASVVVPAVIPAVVPTPAPIRASIRSQPKPKATEIRVLTVPKRKTLVPTTSNKTKQSARFDSNDTPSRAQERTSAWDIPANSTNADIESSKDINRDFFERR